MRRTGSDGGSSAAGGEEAEGGEVGWEMRPGGLLVQKRRADPKAAAAPVVRVRISHGAVRYEISVSSLATFGKNPTVLAGVRFKPWRINYWISENTQDFLDNIHQDFPSFSRIIFPLWRKFLYAR